MTLYTGWISFTGKQLENENQLKWKVVDLGNNKGFNIERSVDGIRFLNIGFVESNNIQVYDYTDNILFDWSNFYYRITQVDFNGHENKSNTILINNNKNKGVTIYPTLFRNELFLDFNQEIEGVNVSIFNTLGQEVLREEIKSDNNSIKINNRLVSGTGKIVKQ